MLWLFVRAALVVAIAILPNAVAAAPNIVVIMTDDQDDINSVRSLFMPSVVRHFKEGGVLFRNSYVNFSACCPSRSSFFTGQAAHNHGVRGNIPATDGGYAKFVRREAETIGVWLQRVGYVTALLGKYLNGYDMKEAVMPATHVPPGWTEWQAMTRVSYNSPVFNENGTLVTHTNRYSTDVLAEKAVDFIKRRAGGAPFFLAVFPKGPHGSGSGPALPAPRHVGKVRNLVYPHRFNVNEADVSDKPAPMQAVPLMDATALQRAAVMRIASREALMSVDEMVDDIIGALEQTGQLTNTVLIFTSDNGFAYGEHRVLGKAVVYEESIRVPLLIRGPGFPAGQVRDHLANNLDVVTTILSLAGFLGKQPHPLDGRSLRLIAANPSVPWRTALLVQGMHPGGIGRFFAVRTANSVYAEIASSSLGIEEEFYDLATDPAQMHNRASDELYAARVAELRALLATLKDCRGPTCWVTTPTGSGEMLGRSSAGSKVYKGKPPTLYGSRADYNRQQILDEGE